MTNVFLIILIVLLVANILITLIKKPRIDIRSQLRGVEDAIIRFDNSLEKSDKSLLQGFKENRLESNNIAKENRMELSRSLSSFAEVNTLNNKDLNEMIHRKFGDFNQRQSQLNEQSINAIREIKDAVQKQLEAIKKDNAEQLTEMRRTVDEKLQKTLNERLSHSFETVGNQLRAVQEGLGEMRNIATDVGGLKRVLSNVKMRGGIGEIQLSMLLDQILAPDQFEANVQTKPGSPDVVEFAIKLPGRDSSGQPVWLPVDAKFPRDVYEHLLDAYDTGDLRQIEAAQKNLDTAIKRMANDISSKYLAPPNTTDFGIMFLPFEGIYAEVVRKAALLEELQRTYKVIVTGPTTLAAILNSLQMGFKTLAIQKRSGEVWKVLGAVKKEFENFGNLMGKAQKNIQTGLGQLDQVMGVRTRAIQRRLSSVEALSNPEAREILPDIPAEPDEFDEAKKVDE